MVVMAMVATCGGGARNSDVVVVVIAIIPCYYIKNYANNYDMR